MKEIMRRKRERDKNAYHRGFEDGGFAGMAAAILIFSFIVFVLIPNLPPQ